MITLLLIVLLFNIVNIGLTVCLIKRKEVYLDYLQERLSDVPTLRKSDNKTELIEWEQPKSEEDIAFKTVLNKFKAK